MSEKLEKTKIEMESLLQSSRKTINELNEKIRFCRIIKEKSYRLLKILKLRKTVGHINAD